MPDTVFYLLSAVMLIGAIGVVTLRNILHAAMSLVGTFFTTAILYLGMKAEFVAITQVLVYIGGIVVFVIFSILLTTRLGESHLPASARRKVFAGILALALLGFLGYLLMGAGFGDAVAGTERIASLDDIGVRLLKPQPGGFLVPFEIISVLLLAAMIGAIVVARRPRDESPEEKA